MGDDDDGETLVAGKFLQQIQNLCLRGDVQRGGSFVGNQYFRLGGNGHGNHDALTHTARKMLRILVIAAFRIRNADLAHDFQGALLGGVLVQFQVEHDGFLNLVADGQHRFNEVIGSWKIIPILPPRMLRISLLLKPYSSILPVVPLR